jgi:hypothetical protein
MRVNSAILEMHGASFPEKAYSFAMALALWDRLRTCRQASVVMLLGLLRLGKVLGST